MKQQSSKLLTVAAVSATFLATGISQAKADSVKQNFSQDSSSKGLAQTNTADRTQKNKADAQVKVQKANRAVASAKENLQKANENHKQATAAVNNAEKDVAEAHNGGVDKADQAISEATNKLDKAKEEQKQTQGNLNSANKTQRKQQQKTDEAQSKYNEAQKNKEQAQKDFEYANTAVNKQQKYLEGLTEENLNQAKEDTENQINKNKTAKTDKEKELEQVKKDQQKSKDELADKQAAKEQAEQDLKNAQNKSGFDQAKQELESAQQKQKQAQKHYAQTPKFNLTNKQVQLWKKSADERHTYNELTSDPDWDHNETIDNAYEKMTDDMFFLTDALFESNSDFFKGITEEEFVNSFFDEMNYDFNDDQEVYTSLEQLSKEQLTDLNSFELDILQQATYLWTGKHITYTNNLVDQEFAEDFAKIKDQVDQEVAPDDSTGKWDDVFEKNVTKLKTKYSVESQSYGTLFSLPSSFTINTLKNHLYAGLLNLFLFSDSEQLADWLSVDSAEKNVGFGISDGVLFITEILKYDVNGVTPDKTPIKHLKQSNEYKAELTQAKQQVTDAQAKVNTFYNKVSKTRISVIDVTTAKENLENAIQALSVAQNKVNSLSQQIAQLTETVSQLKKDIQNDQAKAVEIEDTLANLPEKQAEAQQKLTELKNDAAVKEKAYKVAQDELQEKEAELIVAQEKLANATDEQTKARISANKVNEKISLLETNLKDAQTYKYRMEHAEEILSVAKAKLAMADQAVIDAKEQLIFARNDQNDVQQQLVLAKAKQKQARKNHSAVVVAHQQVVTNGNDSNVINLTHQAFVLPEGQQGNNDKTALPETGAKENVSRLGVLGLLGLLLSLLGFGGMVSSKDRRRRV
ncbi:hypothetical protein GNF18_09780 [Ligilactobacillus pobuzihii]|uniref:hypothetical protein n=1 Tax=Ligilactobacillus pobuzihii TaxID=449659 RepID=UPI0019D1C0CC|nr:hypothetical protein [Ligilactobacillus pobuzihii]MBN7275429.1 hypothetical protein [Ligilactobacillus pobuzihii]